MFSFSSCPFCKRAKVLLNELGASYEAIELDQMGPEGMQLRAELAEVGVLCALRALWGKGVVLCVLRTLCNCLQGALLHVTAADAVALAQPCSTHTQMTDRTSMPSIWISGERLILLRIHE